MTRKLNNAHLRDIADTVDPSGTTGAKMLNNEYLERIANGIGSITDIVDPGTGKIDSSMLEGVIDASNLPSYVDDVVEGYYHQGAFYSDSAHANTITGETGKIYVDVPSGATYRWGGSAYAKVGGPDVEIATTQDAVTGTNDTKVMTPLKTKQAIDASGVPEMSADVRGGAKLDADGGLALRDGALGVGSLVQESDGQVRGGIASLTAKGHAEQASTTGKNLISRLSSLTNDYFAFGPDNTSIVVKSSPSSATSKTFATASVTAGSTYTLSGGGDYTYIYASVDGANKSTNNSDRRVTFTPQSSATININIVAFANAPVKTVTCPQLELGSTATEYEPYSGGVPSPSPAWPQEIVTVTGHAITGKTGRYVDLEVRQGSTLLSTTPIPLPSRGWVGSLPDGTADVLRLDGAGKVEWTLPTKMVGDVSAISATSFNGSAAVPYIVMRLAVNGVDSTVANIMSNGYRGITITNLAERVSGTSYIANAGKSILFFNSSFESQADAVSKLSGVTVLYPLATPVTEVASYIDMPSIAGDATVSIPELDELGMSYFIDDAVVEYGRQIYERVRGEYANRIEQLEQSVAELVAGA